MSLDMTLSSWPLAPEEVKRREYYGMAIFTIGVLGILAGMVGLVFTLQTGAALLCLGIVAMLAGPLVLANIPIVANLPE